MKKMLMPIVIMLVLCGCLKDGPDPLVHYRGVDGVCVRVIDQTTDKEIPNGCNTIDLENGHYDSLPVYGMDVEVTQLKAEMAEQEALRLARQ